MSMKELDAAVIGFFMVCAFVFILLVLTVPLTLYSAFVLIKLWEWFAIPLLTPCMTHVPILNYPIAIGLSLIASMFNNPKLEVDKEKGWKPYLTLVIKISMTWLTGWIVHLFM